MAKKEELVGPLRTNEGENLGGEKVNSETWPAAKSIPDPMGYDKSSGAKGGKSQEGSY